MMQFLAVAIGGSLGAMGRYGLAISLPFTPGKIPFPTLLANVLGSFIIGVLFVIIIDKQILPLIWRQILMVGLLGAFTTFSTFSLETVQLLHGGHIKLAFIYMVTSVIGCVASCYVGYFLTEKFF